jgi:hypothetical protein
MESLLAFAAAVITLRLSALLAGRWRARRAPELAAWSVALFAFAAASAALAWGAAAGWNAAAFRVYYLFGALLTAPLLGVGSVLLSGRRWAAPLGFAYAGLAVGIALAMPLHGTFSGTEIPDTAAHLEFFPARLTAIVGNALGTLAVIAIALASIRRRPFGNALILAGVAVAAIGSALFGVGVASTSASLALAAGLLYAGFVARPRRTGRPPAVAQPDGQA